jgi:hypothetical protein
MVITVVLRLLAGPLESGDLVGHVEHVSSGNIEAVRGAAEIVQFVRQAAAGADPATAARGGASAQREADRL